MSRSFIYQPHVRQFGGTIITPDIAIDRVYVAGGGTPASMPVSWLTSDVVLQHPEGDPLGAAAIVLGPASYGVVVSVGAIMNSTLPVARQAWRLEDISDVSARMMLRSQALKNGSVLEKTTVLVGDLTSPEDMVKSLGSPLGLKPGTMVFLPTTQALGEDVAADRFEVTLEAGEETLVYGLDLEGIF